jgi:hypothetical protein
MTCPSPKFSDKQLRPFKVMKVVGKGTYKLIPPCYSQLHLVLPVVKLELAKTCSLAALGTTGCCLSSRQIGTKGGRLLRSSKHGSTMAASGTCVKYQFPIGI